MQIPWCAAPTRDKPRKAKAACVWKTLHKHARPQTSRVISISAFENCMLACNTIPQQKLNSFDLTVYYRKSWFHFTLILPWWALRSRLPSTFNLVWAGRVSYTRTGWSGREGGGLDCRFGRKTCTRAMLFQLFVSPHVLSVVRQRGKLAWLKLTKDAEFEKICIPNCEWWWGGSTPPPCDAPLQLDEIMTVGRHYTETELNCLMRNMVNRLKSRRCFHICWSWLSEVFVLFRHECN